MASLPKSEIIKKNPVGGGLDAFHDSFGSACVKLGHRVSPDTVQQLSNEGEIENYCVSLSNVYRS